MCIIICDDENVIDASSKTMAMRDTTTSQENDCGRSNKELQGVQLENSQNSDDYKAEMKHIN